MTSHQFVAVRLCLYLISGILLGDNLTISIELACLFTAVSFLALTVGFKTPAIGRTSVFGLLVYCTTFSIGVLAVSINNPWNYSNYFSFHQPASEDRINLSITQELKPSLYYSRYIAEVNSIGGTSVLGELLLEVKEPIDSTQLVVDNVISVWGAPKRLQPALNPGGFDYASHMAKKGIYHRLRIHPEEILNITDGQNTLKGLAAKTRATLMDGLNRTQIKERELSVIKALVLGYRFDLSQPTYNAYKDSGAVHILAVSGLHVGILLVFLRIVLRPLAGKSHGNSIYLVAQLLLLWGYAFITGLSPSVIRAVTMCSFLAYALYLNRPSNAYNILGLSVLFILLLIDPQLLFQVGFQMSYAAVIGIIWVYPVLEKFYRPRFFLARKVKEILLVSIAAQAGVLPVSLLYFHQFPSLFFITNLLLMPILGLLLGYGIIIFFLQAMVSVPDIILSVYEKLIWIMNELVIQMATLEGFTLKNIRFDFPMLILCYAILIWTIEFLKTRKIARLKYALLAIFGFQLYSLYCNFRTASKNELIVFHQYKESLLAEKNGLHLITRGLDTGNRLVLRNYALDNGVRSTKYTDPKNCYLYTGQKIYILDSLGIIPDDNYRPDYLLITYSPKVNPERLLRRLKPGSVIADGSNYPSVAEHWRQSCQTQGIPFHYTATDGAMVLSEYN